jgi:hypothetical protein
MRMLDTVKRKLIEALGGSILGDRGTAMSDEDIGFRPITGGKGRKTRDLTILSSKEMIDVALFLYHSNALAEFLVDMPVSLVVGQELGYSVAVNADQAEMTPDDARDLTNKIRQALDAFWYHPAHDVSTKAPEYARTFLVTGHLVLPVVAVNSVSGVPQFDLIDAGQISAVIPRGNSAIVPGVVKFNSSGVADKEQAMLILQRNVDGLLLARAPEDVMTAADAGERPQVLDPGVTIMGEGLYFHRNKLLNSMRGISYLMPVADWLDALDQFTWATLDRAKLRNAIVWHLKLMGMTDENKIAAEVQRVIGVIGKAGSVYGSNETAELEAKSAEIGAGDTVELGRMILTHILGSKGIPESWYSNGGDSNRSTAAEQTDVAYKALQAMQTAFKKIYRALLWVAYDSIQAKQSVYPKRTESPWLTIEPDMPVVQERDMSRMAAALGQLVSALSQGRDDEFISARSSRRTVLDAISQVAGASFDLDAEEAQIATEKKERDARDAQAQADAARLALQRGLGKGKTPPSDGPPAPDPVKEATGPGIDARVGALEAWVDGRRDGLSEAAAFVPAPPAPIVVQPAVTITTHAAPAPNVTVDNHVEPTPVEIHNDVPPVPPTPVEIRNEMTVQPAGVTVLPGPAIPAPVVMHETRVEVQPTPSQPVTVQTDVHIPDTLKVNVTGVPTTEQEIERGPVAPSGKPGITKTITRQRKE